MEKQGHIFNTLKKMVTTLDDHTTMKSKNDLSSKTNILPASKKVARSVSLALHPEFALYCDGAARGNPGEAGVGVYITEHATPIIQHGFYVGQKTNNQAEYLALALGLFLFKKWCHDHTIEHPAITIFADSELLIRQMSGLYKTKNPSLQKIRQLIDQVMKGIACSFHHVMREQNKHADALANRGIDRKIKIPTEFLKILSDYGLL